MKKIFVLCTIAVIAFGMLGCQKKNQTDYEYIKSKGSMTIGITLFAPMNYHDAEGNLVGFDTDFAKAVCDKLGLEANFVEISWDLKETELTSKNIDCIWNGMTITEKLKTNFSITKPYLQNRQILITKTDKIEQYEKSADGISVSVEQGSAAENVTKTLGFFEKATITPVDSQTKALLEVKSGLADAAVVDYVISFGAIGEGTDFADLAVADVILGDPELYGIALRKGSDMTDKINKIITEMTADGSLKAIAEKYKLDGLMLD
ncbi:MAG: transporter substrate-binding domain-containing protein [Spirochaetales bacterium]|nr:transporter substrate-binding domain-containing protein [Spirochaetales bacterium]